MGGVDAKAILLADADVLIDFVRTRPGTLRLVAEHLGRLLVLAEVLATIDQLTKKQCRAYGIEVVTVETEMLLAAGTKKRRTLSFEDHLGLLACKTNGWTMVTNDRVLMGACKEEAVPFRRGLRLVLDLVAGGGLKKQAAWELAVAIHRENPRHINEHVLEKFKAELSKL